MPTKRKIWQAPWAYKEAAAFCIGLLAIGLFLQIAVGPISRAIFAFPYNIYLSIFFIALIGMAFIFANKSGMVRWLSATPTAITTILAFGFIVILMGLTPQHDTPRQESSEMLSLIGLDNITQTWYFAFLYLFLLTILTFTILKRGIPLKAKNIGFVVNHLGLWVVLFAGVLGNGDIARLKMTIYEGKVEWRASDAMGVIYEMPIAIQLNDFKMEEYPPKLYAIDTRTGDALPLSKPQFIAIEGKNAKGMIGRYAIETQRYIADAAPVKVDKFEHVYMPGTSPAAFIKTKTENSNTEKSGWVSSGSFAFPHKALYLNDTVGLVLKSPEPKKFESNVTIFTKDGKQLSTIIEVNKPFSVNGWKLYQLGYNDKEGKWSSYSTIELVKDPWLPVVYSGITLLLLGSISMFWNSNKHNQKKHVE